MSDKVGQFVRPIVLMGCPVVRETVKNWGSYAASAPVGALRIPGYQPQNVLRRSPLRYRIGCQALAAPREQSSAWYRAVKAKTSTRRCRAALTWRGLDPLSAPAHLTSHSLRCAAVRRRGRSYILSLPRPTQCVITSVLLHSVQPWAAFLRPVTVDKRPE